MGYDTPPELIAAMAFATAAFFISLQGCQELSVEFYIIYKVIAIIADKIPV